MKPFYFFILCCFVWFACQTPNTSTSDKNSFYTKAIDYRNQQKGDSAFLYFNKAKEVFLQQQDSLGAGKCLINMAIISTTLGDNFGGQELSIEALSYLKNTKPTHHVYLVSNYNNLGIAANNLKQFGKAVEFYKKSVRYTSDISYATIVKNNIGHAYQQNGDYFLAINTYKGILNKSNHPINYARILSNLAYTQWLNNSDYNPLPDLWKALAIRNKENDALGQNASYAYLADYYLSKRSDSSFFYASKMLASSRALYLPDEQLAALSKLIKSSSANVSKTYFNQYQQLNDSLQTVRNAAKNQFALIRFETEQYKATSLKLQKENKDRNVLIFIILITVGAGITVGYLWYKKREERLEFEAANRIKENQLKVSKKVHDVVANGLYRLMSEVENQPEMDRDQVLDDIELLYDKSRAISYDDELEIEDANAKDFNQTIKKLFTDFASTQVKVVIIGNEPNYWAEVSEYSKKELYQVLLELMVNMRKHSKATYVAIRFEEQENQKAIYYSDNGLGMPKEQKFNNGLRNTGNRIQSIKGSITFEKGAEGGTKILILFPTT